MGGWIKFESPSRYVQITCLPFSNKNDNQKKPSPATLSQKSSFVSNCFTYFTMLFLNFYHAGTWPQKLTTSWFHWFGSSVFTVHLKKRQSRRCYSWGTAVWFAPLEMRNVSFAFIHLYVRFIYVLYFPFVCSFELWFFVVIFKSKMAALCGQQGFIHLFVSFLFYCSLIYFATE